jgi:hypothetical protein
MVEWTKRGKSESLRVHIIFFAYKVESFSIFLYKFFVVYEMQQSQKNYNITFKTLFIIIIKIEQNLVKF